MSMEDRLRNYLANKAETIDVTAGATVATPPPQQRRRVPAVAFAAAAALLVVGLPLIVLSLAADTPGLEQAQEVTTTAATDSTGSAAMDRFTTIAGVDDAGDPGGIVINSLAAPEAAALPTVVEQSLRPATSDDMPLGEFAWDRLGETERSTPLLLTSVNQESGAYTVQWVVAGAGDVPDSLCLAIVAGREVTAPFCSAAFGVSGTPVPVATTADGMFHIASNEIPLATSYVVLTSEQAESALQIPVSGNVLFEVRDGEFTMAAFGSDGVELARWHVTVGRPQGPAETTTWCNQVRPTQPEGTVLAFYAQCAPDPGIPYPLYRSGEGPFDLQQSLEALLAGTTTTENAMRIYTGFDSIPRASEATVDAQVDSAGVAHVEFSLDGSVWLPDTASWSSAQLNSLLDPLYAAVFADPEVAGLDMSGLCFEQVACDRIVTRTEWQTNLFNNGGMLSHAGCTPEWAWIIPRQCTAAGAMSGADVSATVVGLPSWDTLNLRAGPSIDYLVLAELELGSAVTVGRAVTTSSNGGTWTLVDAGASGVGWVFTGYLEIEPSSLPAPTNFTIESVGLIDFELTWDEVAGAADYVVQMDGRDIARTFELSYLTGDLEVGGVYTFTVIAVDAEGRLSPASQPVTAIPEETS